MKISIILWENEEIFRTLQYRLLISAILVKNWIFSFRNQVVQSALEQKKFHGEKHDRRCSYWVWNKLSIAYQHPSVVFVERIVHSNTHVILSRSQHPLLLSLAQIRVFVNQNILPAIRSSTITMPFHSVQPNSPCSVMSVFPSHQILSFVSFSLPSASAAISEYKTKVETTRKKSKK